MSPGRRRRVAGKSGGECVGGLLALPTNVPARRLGVRAQLGGDVQRREETPPHAVPGVRTSYAS
ncbi:hypothetical protein [Streptomyces sp. NPDC056723]|uniref:hypothetical protein n=1 Tax=Streptomyces sp. NPDC056723 TaxID=3345925 RepID=UPI00367D2EB7